MDSQTNQTPKQNLPPFKSKESQELVNVLGKVSSNLKILEDRYSNLRRKTQLTDQVLIETQRGFAKEKRLINEDLLEVKRKIQDMSDDLDEMKKELSEAVSMDDFIVLKKYVEYWELLRFVTRKEVEDYFVKR